MAVYVDQITDYSGRLKGHVGRISQQWCHMTADTLEELHDMAARIGMKRTWFQSHALLHRCHYDLVPARRAAAIGFGAIEVQRLEHARRLKAEGRSATPSGLEAI